MCCQAVIHCVYMDGEAKTSKDRHAHLDDVSFDMRRSLCMWLGQRILGLLGINYASLPSSIIIVRGRCMLHVHMPKMLRCSFSWASVHIAVGIGPHLSTSPLGPVYTGPHRRRLRSTSPSASVHIFGVDARAGAVAVAGSLGQHGWH